MSIRYGQSTYQCGRYQAIGWESRCTPGEIWVPEVITPEGNLIEVYTFDASVAGPTDPDSAWTNDANAFDGSLSTFANTVVEGSKTANYLSAQGFSSDFIDSLVMSKVRHRVYGRVANIGVSFLHAVLFTYSGSERGTAVLYENDAPAWSEWVENAIPSSGRIQRPWSPEELDGAELRIYAFDDKAGTVVDVDLYAIQLEVEYEQGWGSRVASDETWSQTDPRVN